MAKSDRLEDLGAARERLSRVLDNSDVFDYCDSKHNLEEFADKIDNDDGICVLHCQIRDLREELYEVLGILMGDE